MVAVDTQSFMSTVLGVIAAADIVSASDRRIALNVREPTSEERAVLEGCAAVVQLDLGAASAQLSDGAADLLTRRGGRMLLSRSGEAQGVRFLLPSAAPRCTETTHG